ncbi:hypothetical protein V7S82_24145, partial [Enterobacter hormaechei subsp. steigerwaltii]|uniref:hypothetical protein n=1 Tax=Enterobacter hormaechei TaxID=158836 RepID=UPI003204F3DA
LEALRCQELVNFKGRAGLHLLSCHSFSLLDLVGKHFAEMQKARNAEYGDAELSQVPLPGVFPQKERPGAHRNRHRHLCAKSQNIFKPAKTHPKIFSNPPK